MVELFPAASVHFPVTNWLAPSLSVTGEVRKLMPTPGLVAHWKVTVTF